jgi:uncharacterized integral membrane protein
MRLVVIIMTFLLFVGIIGFVITNLDQKVTVTVWRTAYEELPLFLLVILAVFAGICYAGIIGVAEGTQIRLSNRALVREVARLETEINYLRTQPAPAPRPEPDAVPEPEVAAVLPGIRPGVPTQPPVAAAPVYGTEEDWGADEDDDPYTGGRAV